jgi:hypothetical protein
MKNVKIFSWSADSEPESGVWVVNEEDKEDFEVVQELFEEFPVFLLKRGHRDAAAIAHVYLSLKHFGSPSHINDEIRLSYDFGAISAILSAIDAFASLDSQKLEFLVQEIGRMTRGKSRYDRIVFFLEVLVTISAHMRKTYYQSIYGCLTQNCWWFEIPQFRQSFRIVLEEIKKLQSPFREAVREVYEDLKTNFDRFSKKNVGEVFMVVSAYCFSLASYFNDRGLLIDSYLSIHRALDLFFTSLAINLGFISVKRDYLIYHDQDAPTVNRNDVSRIALITTYFEYLTKVISLSREEEESVRRINKKRNTLLLTHGVESVSINEVNDAYRDARKIMRDDRKWNEYLNNFRLHIRLDASYVLYELLGVKGALSEL